MREKQGRKTHKKMRHMTEPTSLASMAAEKYQAHHSLLSPQFGHGGPKNIVTGSPQSGGGLIDIMDEQMALQLQENELVRIMEHALCLCGLMFRRESLIL